MGLPAPVLACGRLQMQQGHLVAVAQHELTGTQAVSRTAAAVGLSEQKCHKLASASLTLG